MRRRPLLAVLAAPPVLAGCTSSGAPGSQVRQAVQVLDLVRLPPGAAPLAATDVPTSFRSSDLGCAVVVVRDRSWRVPGMTIDVAQTWFEAHVPAGLRADGSGSGGDVHGETMTEVDDAVLASGPAAPGSRVVLRP